MRTVIEREIDDFLWGVLPPNAGAKNPLNCGRDISIAMSGRMMHSVAGELKYQPYGKDGQAIYSVSRGQLNIKLLQLADQYPNIHMF